MPKVGMGKKKGFRRRRPLADARNAAATTTTDAAGSRTAGRLSGFKAEAKKEVNASFRDAKAKLAAAKAAGDKTAAHAAHDEIKTARKARKGVVQTYKGTKNKKGKKS
jgi:hypothetical protein